MIGRKIKICGVNSEAAFDAVCESGADYAGFVFFEKSPRFVSGAQAARLAVRAMGGPQTVGLFVLDEHGPLDAIAVVLDVMRLDALQIYAHRDRSEEVLARFGVPVWRSVHVAEKADLPPSRGDAEALLIEPRALPGDTRPGGLGRNLPLEILEGWKPDFFWFLAGGLAPQNVGAAIARTRVRGVDVSSGVESAPGVKDVGKIRDFVRVAREAWTHSQ